MTRPADVPGIDSTPAIATWELWTVAKMLVTTHGDSAEAHAQVKLGEAQEQNDEAGEIVWSGVITQLARIRAGQ